MFNPNLQPNPAWKTFYFMNDENENVNKKTRRDKTCSFPSRHCWYMLLADFR